MEPKDYIKSTYFNEYQNISRFLINQKENIHINKYIIDKLRFYPITDILNEYSIFISTTFNNSINTCILSFSKLLTDEGDELLTLDSFKNKILKNVENNEVLITFKNSLKEQKKYRIHKVKDKIRKIRNSSIAHSNLQIINDEYKQDSILWDEFNSICSYINNYIDILTFHQTTMFLDTFSYHPEIDMTPKPINDLDVIIELMENNSKYIKNIIEYDWNREFCKEEKSPQEVLFINKILERNGGKII